MVPTVSAKAHKKPDFVFGDAYSERRKNRFVQITERANVAPRYL